MQALQHAQLPNEGMALGEKTRGKVNTGKQIDIEICSNYVICGVYNLLHYIFYKVKVACHCPGEAMNSPSWICRIIFSKDKCLILGLISFIPQLSDQIKVMISCSFKLYKKYNIKI